MAAANLVFLTEPKAKKGSTRQHEERSMNQSVCMDRNNMDPEVSLPILGRLRCFMDGWRLAVVVVATFVALPILVIFSSLLSPEKEIWQHFAETLLMGIALNTAVLVTGVLAGTSVLGISLAWLTGACEFPGRRIFSWALLLPLAIPTYVFAFVFLGLFDFSGPVQTLLRSLSPDKGFWFPNIRSAGGVILVMSLALYPYVYLLSRDAFKTQGRRALEASQSLGCNRWTSFFKVALPLARPWIAGGLLLVMMETLADFGAVSIFNYDTFTTAIYKAWFGFFSLPAAAQLSSVLVMIVLAVILIEDKVRKRMQFFATGRSGMDFERIRLAGWIRWAAFAYVLFIVLVGFGIPLTQLLFWSFQIVREEFNGRYLVFFGNSVYFALLTTIIVCAVAVILSYAQRRHKDPATRFMVRFSTLGYALPGTVLAVGIVVIVSFVDNIYILLARITVGIDSGPIIQGTILSVIMALMIRFFAAGFNAISSTMHRITPNIDEASISMGVTGFSLLKRVHFPLLKSGIMTAAMLVFVDVMKEMPITLMTRPFGRDTLAVKIFELTSEGEWERAALPAIVLVLGGLIPVIILTRQTET